MEQDRCRDLSDHLPAFVTGDLPPDLTLRIQKHLGDVCASCSSRIERLHDAFQRIPLASAPCPLPEGSIDALLKKIGAEPQEEREVPIVFRETNEGKLAWSLVLFATAALIAVGFWARSMDQRLGEAESLRQASDLQTRRVVNDYRDLEAKARSLESHLDAVTDPRVLTSDLTSLGTEGHVRAFIDPTAHRVIVTLAGLPTSGPEQQYAVWWGAKGSWTLLGRIDKRREAAGGARTYSLPEGQAGAGTLRVSLESTAGEPPSQPSAALFETSTTAGQEPTD